MSYSGRMQTTPVDESVVYCTGNDVFTHIRNKRYVDLDDAVDPGKTVGEVTSLTKEQVTDLIEGVTEDFDKATKRAWRRRRVEQYDVRVRFPHDLKRGKSRRRGRVAGVAGVNRTYVSGGRRGHADLPHVNVFTPDSGEGDVVEVLNPREAVDITDDEGRSNGSWTIDERKGVIKPEVTLFVPTGTSGGAGRDLKDAKIRVSYRYGQDPAPTSPSDLHGGRQLSTAVPRDVRDAVALKVAAKLIGGDQYGEITPNQSGDGPSLAEAVSSWEAEYQNVVDEYGRL